MSAPINTPAETYPNSTATGALSAPAAGVTGGTSGVAPGSAGTAGTTTTTGATGQGVGEKIKGGFGVIHGAGEALRGSINSLLDQAGEGVAQRKPTDPQPVKRSDGGLASADVANNGVDEINRGMNAFKK